MNLSNLSFVDIETTGTSLKRDKIIEIAILKIKNNRLVKKYQTLINPEEVYLSPYIENITGIKALDLEKAPTFTQIKDDVLELLRNSIFVAHNVRFDYGFLKYEFRRHNIKFSSPHFCTVKLSRFLYPNFQHHNLDSLIERHNISCKNRHRALSDALVLWKFYKLSQKTHTFKKVEEAIKEISKKPSLPSKLKNTIKIPSLPGVYIFWGSNNAPLYIGKSINLKKRVFSHFSNDHRTPLEMKLAQLTESIETIVTAGELGALIKESQLIKKLQPLYNRMLRKTHKLVTLLEEGSPENYLKTKLVSLESLKETDLRNVLGVFRSTKLAREFLINQAKIHTLCPKLLSLEKSKDSCFSYQLDWCNGACIRKESPLKYNIRHTVCFSQTRIKNWPFPGPIAITEQHPLSETSETFIVNKWCLVESVLSDAEGYSKETNPINFDLDIYKILKRHLLRNSNQPTIKLLSHLP